jgi:DNA replication protein DnaC
VNLVKQAENIVNKRKKEAENAAENAYEKAMEIPEVKACEVAYCALLPKISRCEALNFDDKKLKESFEKAFRQRKEIFKKYVINEKDFEPRYHCPKCKDTGYYEGKECVCLKQEINAIINREYGAGVFNSFEDGLPENFNELNGIYEKIRKYCECFPDNKYLTLIFRGMSGTGKTCLASCVADSVIKKGYTVIFITAFKLNEIFKMYHLDFKGKGADLLENLYTCDLLVIDDLGTETSLKNITNEYLLSLISERTFNNKHLIVTTNFDDEKLFNKYDGRLTSRLLDKNKTYIFNFTGDDLRQRLKN